jgi:RNA polymerase sigma-70 factor (ECF subfamily)
LKRTNEELRVLCIKGDGNAQNELYHRFAPKLWGVCLRYAKDRMSAEDILQEGFIRIFTYLDRFQNKGSFEGWMRRTMVNTAINYYKKNLSTAREAEYNEYRSGKSNEADALSNMSHQELLALVQKMPNGYRTVFNLYIIEGYSHKDIAKSLNISENTSKSQLSRARAYLQEQIRINYGDER